jgi:hypothetical protein
MAETPPPVGSLDFHLRFLPLLLWRRLRSPAAGATRGHPEVILLPLFGLAVNVIGANFGEDARWLAFGAGLLALLLAGIRSTRARPPQPLSWEELSLGVFTFGLLAGLGVGLIVGASGPARPWDPLMPFVGLVVGYVGGLAGGYWTQRLGTLAWLIGFSAGVLCLGVVVLDLVMLAAWTTRV